MTNTAGSSRVCAPGPATTLRHLPALAAQYIQRVGWTQGTEQARDGSVCLTGALRLCVPVPGDGYIAREVFRCKGHLESWNDELGRTQHEVVGYLSATEINENDLAEIFGPQWPEIIALIRRAAGFTADDVNELNAAGDAFTAALAAAWTVANYVPRPAARHAARDAFGAVAGDGPRVAAGAAALALVVRDLIGQHDFTQEHYDELTRLWRTTIGPLHPEDADLGMAVRPRADELLGSGAGELQVRVRLENGGRVVARQDTRSVSVRPSGTPRAM